MKDLIKVEIKNQDGKLLVSSRDIAKGLEKKHKHVLDKIKEILGESEFRPTYYVDVWNRKQTEYLLDKDAFILLY